MRILLAEDERDLNRILTNKLKDAGYSVDACFDGAEALEYLDAADYDGAILDVMMPKMDGFEVLKKLRELGKDTPVMFLTARDTVADRVRGLDLGACDYMIKPFSMEELLARVRVLMRERYNTADNILRADDLEMDTKARTVKRGEREIALSAKEYALLEYLLMNKNIVLTREQIEDHIWNFDYEGGTNVVDVYISYLRRKIDDGFENRLIRTVRGCGYKLQCQ